MRVGPGADEVAAMNFKPEKSRRPAGLEPCRRPQIRDIGARTCEMVDGIRARLRCLPRVKETQTRTEIDGAEKRGEQRRRLSIDRRPGRLRRTGRDVRQAPPKAYFATLHAKRRASTDRHRRERILAEQVDLFPRDIDYGLPTPITDGGRITAGPD